MELAEDFCEPDTTVRRRSLALHPHVSGVTQITWFIESDDHPAYPHYRDKSRPSASHSCGCFIWPAVAVCSPRTASLERVLLGAIMRVMIGSTLDLNEERVAAERACIECGCLPTRSENWRGEDETTLQISLRNVRENDVYVCIIGERYGTPVGSPPLSYTERELVEALQTNRVKVLVFEKTKLEFGPGNIDVVDLAARQDFVSRIKSGTIIRQPYVRPYQNSAELRTEIIKALHQYSARSDVEPAANLVYPRKFIRNGYTLLEIGEAVGRDDVFAMLDLWAEEPGRPICVMEAIGGMGKSAVSWSWANRWLEREKNRILIWYGFYGPGVSYRDFLINGCATITPCDPNTLQELPNSRLEDKLVDCLNRSPVLVVLDGFERQLRAYDTFDPSKLSDEEIDNRSVDFENVSTSTSGATVPVDESRRACTNPYLGIFLKKRLRELCGASRILITTRLMPKALEMRTGGPHGRVQHLQLKGLDLPGARVLWALFNVKSSDHALQRLVRQVEGYPLVLVALAGKIRSDLHLSYDSWIEDNPHFDTLSAVLTADEGRSQVLFYALRDLPESQRGMLQFMAALPRQPSLRLVRDFFLFDRPKGVLSAIDDEWLLDDSPPKGHHDLHNPIEQHSMTKDTFNAAIRGLRDRGLIGLDLETMTFELHPVVRSIIWSAMTATDQKVTFAAIERHLQATPDAHFPSDEAKSVDDLILPLQLFHALMAQGKYADAIDLYGVRLRPILGRLNEQQTMKDLTDLFFEREDGKIKIPIRPLFVALSDLDIPTHSKKRSRGAAHTLEFNALHDFTADAGNLYQLYGDLHTAMTFYQMHNTTCSEPLCRSGQIYPMYAMGYVSESERLLANCVEELLGWLSAKRNEHGVNAPYQLWRIFGAFFAFGERKGLIELQAAALEKRLQLFEKFGFGIFQRVSHQKADIGISLCSAKIDLALSRKDLALAMSLLPDLRADVQRRNTADARHISHLQYGRVLMAREDFEDASVQFQKAIEQISEDSLRLAMLGVRVELAGAETACSRFDTARDLLDTTAELCVDRGHLMTLADIRLAQADVARSLEDEEAEREALLDVLYCHKRNGPPVRGYASLEQALRRLMEKNWIDDDGINDLHITDGIAFTELDCARITRAAILIE
ncbi:DUF4062 domain-containing protein [Rhizobium leguminosarum]